MKKSKKTLSPADWEKLPEEDLLKLRVRDLGLTVDGTHLAEKVTRLYDELAARGLKFRPPCYLADEWLTPDRVPVIGIPFYLAHQRLVQLERKMMLEVEGGTDYWCMRLLRHEAGHAINYAFKLYTRTRWRDLFGPFSMPYTTNYYFEPYSRRYVVHLEDNYAQAHPDEDFAETFAVWLNPVSDWKARYKGWPALKKLNYVDRLMGSLKEKDQPVQHIETPWSAARMTSTLQAFYDRRRRYATDDFPGFYDPGLARIFSTRPSGDAPVKAGVFLRKYRRQIAAGVARWTGQRKFDIDKMVRKLTRRCDEQVLYLPRSESETLLEVTAFVTAVMCNIPVFDRGFHLR